MPCNPYKLGLIASQVVRLIGLLPVFSSQRRVHNGRIRTRERNFRKTFKSLPKVYKRLKVLFRPFALGKNTKNVK